MTQVTQGTSIISLGYDAGGRRVSLTLPNGVAVAYAYDAASQLTGLTYTLGGNTIGQMTYGYDATGNRIQIAGSLAATGLPQPLTSASYDSANELTQRNGTACSYDPNGNLTSDGVNTYAWDARGRLVSIAGGVTASFQYDPFGRRTSKTVNGTTTQFLYDGGNVTQELSAGIPTANLLTGLGLDEVFLRTDSAGARALLADGVGSTIALVDSTGVRRPQRLTPSGTVAVGRGMLYFYNDPLQAWCNAKDRKSRCKCKK